MIFWKYNTIVGQNSGGAFIDHNITGAAIQKISTTRRQARISLTVSQVSLSLFTNTSLKNYYQSSQALVPNCTLKTKKFKDGQRAQNQQPLFSYKEKVQLQPVQLLMHNSWRSYNPHASSLRRKAL